MKTRTSKPWRRLRQAPGTISDPATLKNPHARPRRGSLRPPVETTLCAVVDRTAERCEPRMIVLGRPGLGWDNMAGWSLTYRCLYRNGHEDRELHQRDLIAATRAGAIEALRRSMIGFAVETVELFAARPPLTRDEIAEINAANEKLDAERYRLGIYGEDEQRQKAIEEWLRRPAQSARDL